MRGIRKVSEKIIEFGRSLLVTNPKLKNGCTWEPNTRYRKNQLVIFGKIYYISVDDHRSTEQFDNDSTHWQVVNFGEEVDSEDASVPDGTLSLDLKQLLSPKTNELDEYRFSNPFADTSNGEEYTIVPYVSNNNEGVLKMKMPTDKQWADIPMLTAEGVYSYDKERGDLLEYIIIKSGGKNLIRVKM